MFPNVRNLICEYIASSANSPPLPSIFHLALKLPFGRRTRRELAERLVPTAFGSAPAGATPWPADGESAGSIIVHCRAALPESVAREPRQNRSTGTAFPVCHHGRAPTSHELFFAKRTHFCRAILSRVRPGTARRTYSATSSHRCVASRNAANFHFGRRLIL